MFDFQSKNIIILLKSFVLGGAEKQALYLASELQNKRACNVYIYSYIKSPNSELFYQECQKYNLKNLFVVKNPLSASGNFKYLKRRIKIVLFGLNLRKHKPDIIIPYLNPPSIIASLCYKIAGAQTTFWHHRGVDFYRNDKLEQQAVKKAPFFIANSPNGKIELIEVLKAPKEKSFLIPNYSTIDRLNTRKSIIELDCISNKVIIGMIGHFIGNKLQLSLIESIEILLKKGYNIHLVLATSKYNSDDFIHREKSILNLIKKLNLEDNVSIVYDKLAEFVLPYLDIGTLISDNEGMPNVILEYMAYALPIVTVNHKGCENLLGENYPFYVDLQELKTYYIANKLEELIKDKNLRQSIGKYFNTRLNKHFTIEEYLKKLITILYH